MAQQQERTDISVIDRETGELRLLVEVKSRRHLKEDIHRLVSAMRSARIRAGLLIDPRQTILISLPSLYMDRVDQHVMATSELGIRPPVLSATGEGMEREAFQALHTLADAIRQGDFARVPRVFFPEVVSALQQGDLSIEHGYRN